MSSKNFETSGSQGLLFAEDHDAVHEPVGPQTPDKDSMEHPPRLAVGERDEIDRLVDQGFSYGEARRILGIN